MLLPVLFLPLLGLSCNAQEHQLQPVQLARSLLVGRFRSESAGLDQSLSFQERSPQTGCSSLDKVCGSGCMPLTGICCGSNGSFCTLGNYCTNNGGCCPVGKTCTGTPPPPTTSCGGTQVACGSNGCMPRGSVCCSGSYYCNAGETCAPGMMCKSGSGGSGGGNDDVPSVTKIAGYTPTTIGQDPFTMPSAPPPLFWTSHAADTTPTGNGQSAPAATTSPGNSNPGNPGGKSAAVMVHAPKLAAALALLLPLLV